MKIKTLMVCIFSLITFMILGCIGNYTGKDESGISLPAYKLSTVTPEPQFVSINPILYKGYIENPGIGWQRDFSPYSNNLPETVAYGHRLDLTWLALNPQEGIYDWTPLDAQLLAAVKDGKQFSFRVTTMAGEIYGGHQVPQWVLDKGATITPSGDPDYSNCIYQEEWGEFINKLIEKYDGNPDVAFIDISGYGDFNEWSWVDQTEWDEYFTPALASNSLTTLDGQARRRLADMFIGGSFQKHQCRDANGNTKTVSYNYAGAHKTQLLMPNAGIIQSTQYVFSKRRDVGFRFDCLGRGDELPLDIISQIWLEAPIVYEFCGPGAFEVVSAYETIKTTHPTLIHNNDYSESLEDLQELMRPIGYRFFLEQATSDYSINAGASLNLSMLWKNLGTAPAYPKMGQTFELHVYLLDSMNNKIMLDYLAEANISKWMPADILTISSPPEYELNITIPIPASLPERIYVVAVSIINTRTNLPIHLAMEGEYPNGLYSLFKIHIR